MMRVSTLRLGSLIGLAILVGGWVWVAAWADPAAAPAGVRGLVEQMPAQTVADGDRINAELVKMGPPAVKEICALLVSQEAAPAGAGEDDAKARFALSGLAKYVTRAGAEAERAMVAGAILEALGAATDTEVKTFLINQLQLAGKDECVAPLGKLLANEQLCEPATQALLSIATPAAVGAIAGALPSAQGKERVTIMKALGELRGGGVVAPLLADAASSDVATRRTALFALATIGDPAAAEVLAKAAQAQTPYERALGTSWYLLFAQRLAEAGDRAKCEAICRDLLRTRTEPGDANVQSAALSALAGLLGDAVLKDLLAAMDSPNRGLRGTAVQLAARIPGEAATREWLNKMGGASLEARTEILAMLGRRGDTSALPAAVDALKQADPGLRRAGIEAAARLGGGGSLEPLLAVLRSAGAPEDVAAVKGALLQIPGEQVASAVAGALPTAPAPARVALLDVLAARRAKAHLEPVFAQTKDADPSVRTAAIQALRTLAGEGDLPRLIDLVLDAASDSERTTAQEVTTAVAGQMGDAERRADAILAALEKAPSDRKAFLVQMLPGVAGAKALQAVLAAAKGPDEALKDAGIRALAAWPDVAAAPELLSIVENAAEPARQGLAMAGYLRLVETGQRAAEEKVRMYKEALAAAKRPEEKKAVLAALPNVRTADAVLLAAEYLDDAALRNDAAAAVVKLASPADENTKGVTGPQVDPVAAKARGIVEGAEGFVALFNGKDLAGWTGDTTGYVVENGVIVCKPGGNLYTEKDYGDFVFRFEFKLTPGANNGLAIRAPLGGGTYDGMELQILDDSADQYKDLHPYQYHGSIYGIAPAERGHLKPAGEWNEEEVIAKGRQITVRLNGATIVDADLDKVAKPQTIDGKEHQGLDRASGRIGFLGHGTVVEFRNIRIKEVK